MGAAFQVPGQRMHPRGGEQHLVTVRRHQRAARYHLVAPFTEELKEGPDGFGHVHGIGPFWFPAPERDRCAATIVRALANHSRSPARVSSGQAAATGELIARAAAQVKLTFMFSL